MQVRSYQKNLHLEAPKYFSFVAYSFTATTFSTIIWLKSSLLMVEDSLAKLPILKLSLHNSAAFCIRQKLRRDLPENVTL